MHPAGRCRNVNDLAASSASPTRHSARHSTRHSVLILAILLFFAAFSARAQSSSADASQPATAPPPQPASATGPQFEDAPYEPITNHQRFHWFFDETLGPAHLLAGAFTAGFGTARDVPPEYGGTWEGFGKRFAVREAGVSLSNATEAGLGSLWGEDPRYFRVPNETFGRRLRSVVTQTFLAKRRDGTFQLAYARYAGISESNFLSNAWRPKSEADTEHALYRIGWGFAGRMASNAYDEFWPDVKTRVFHRE